MNKKQLIISIFACFCLFGFLSLSAQTKEVNQDCTDDDDCKSGTCLTLESGDKVCGTCSQSTFNSLKRAKTSACGGFNSRWTPKTSEEYQGSEASDGRVSRESFDRMTDKAKGCKNAREKLSETCFKNGERWDKYDHEGQVEQIENSIDKIERLMTDKIRAKEVYYCSKSTYDSRLRTYESKCERLDTRRIKDQLEDMLDDMEDGKKVDCDDIEDWAEDCEECYEAAKDLYDDCFKRSSSYMPEDYYDKMEAAKDMMEEAEKLKDMAEDDDLCD